VADETINNKLVIIDNQELFQGLPPKHGVHPRTACRSML
jgi:hypothetical protein